VYGALCVPTLFVTGAGFFALATATRSMLATYVGVIVFLVLYLVASGYFDRPEFAVAAALADPFGIAAVDLVTKYWTASERNTRLPTFLGDVLRNRADLVLGRIQPAGSRLARVRSQTTPGPSGAPAGGCGGGRGHRFTRR
jgi:hypothetical protein